MPQDSRVSNEFSVTPIYVIIALLVIIVSFLLTRKFKRSTNVVLLVGLSEAGKTALFTKIIFNKPKKSVTSLKENEATLDDLSLKLVDLPGAERLRPRLWDQYREKARNVVFVVDSTAVNSKLRDLSEYLYSLLSDPIIQKNRIGFLIACNKQDAPDAMKQDQIKAVIEKELTAIKETKKGQLGRTSEEATEDRLRALFTDNISLDQLNVQLMETSVNNVDQLIRAIL
jgi:signal recognition particle receptor subunit beta